MRGGFFALTLAAGMAAASAPVTAQVQDDPYIWLEESLGAQAMAWVDAHNAQHDRRELEADPRYERSTTRRWRSPQAKDRIPCRRSSAAGLQLLAGRAITCAASGGARRWPSYAHRPAALEDGARPRRARARRRRRTGCGRARTAPGPTSGSAWSRCPTAARTRSRSASSTSATTHFVKDGFMLPGQAGRRVGGCQNTCWSRATGSRAT